MRGPVTPFGAALRLAIQAETKSEKAFAARAGLTPGRISQIINGSVAVKPETLHKILSALDSPDSQEQVHRAYVDEFLPLPSPPPEELDPEQALQLARQYWKSGQSTRAAQFASSVAAQIDDFHYWHEITGLVAQVHLKLNRPGAALEVIQTMKVRSLEHGERLKLLSSLWLLYLSVENVENATSNTRNRVFLDAQEYAFGVTPAPSERESWRTKKLELTRDFARHVLELYRRRAVGIDQLKEAHFRLSLALSRFDSPQAAIMAREVLARVEIGMGRYDAAEETLQEVITANPESVLELREKILLSQARLAWGRGEIDQAKNLLDQVVQISLEGQNLHHARVADQMLAEIILADVVRRDR